MICLNRMVCQDADQNPSPLAHGAIYLGPVRKGSFQIANRTKVACATAAWEPEQGVSRVRVKAGEGGTGGGLIA